MDTAAIVAHDDVGADLDDHAGGSGDLRARRESRPLGLAGVDRFSDGFSPYALGAKPIPVRRHPYAFSRENRKFGPQGGGCDLAQAE